MTTIVWGTGFESGNPIPASDFYVTGALTGPTIDTEYAKTGSRSFKGNTAPSASCWIRKAVDAYEQPATSMYIWPRDRYYQEIVPGSEESSLPNVLFSFSNLHQYIFRWDGYHKTMCLYWRYRDGSVYKNILLDVGDVKVAQNDFFNFQVWASASFIRAKIDGHLCIAREMYPPAGSYSRYDYIYLEAGYYSLSTDNSGNFDDWIVGHGGWLGDIRVEDLRPTADSSVAFTPIGTGDNYEEIDEVTADDETYNYARSNGLVDEFTIEPFDDETPEGVKKIIRAVEPWVRARIDAATGDHIKVGLNSNSTVDDTQHPLRTAHQYYEHVAEEDPDTEAPWTTEGLNDSLLRYESVIE